MEGPRELPTPNTGLGTAELTTSDHRDAAPPAVPSVLIVVLNWNGWERTLECLRALTDRTYGNARIVVVDNGSSDGSVESIREARPDLEMLRLPKNLGYAGGMNEGIRKAFRDGMDYVWLLNNDTRPDRDALAKLMECAHSLLRIGAVASLGLTHGISGLVSYHTAFRYSGRDEIPIRCDGEFISEGHPCHLADVVSGGSLLISCVALREVGLIDEAYFHYEEEKDLVERLRRARWDSALSCGSVVVHERAASLPSASPQARYYYLRNRLRFRQKLFGEHPLVVLARNPSMLIGAVSPRHTLAFDFRYARAGLLAIVHALRRITGEYDLGLTYRVT